MLLFPAAILTISDESDRDFMKHLYIDHAAQMFRMARALTDDGDAQKLNWYINDIT